MIYWEQRKLGEVANRFDSTRIPISENLRVSGKTPYYGANGIQDYVDGYTHDGEYVLIAEDGANDLKNYPIRLVKGRIWVNNHAHVIQGMEKFMNNQFINFAMSQVDFESIVVGCGRAKLNAEQLMDICFKIPNKNEQANIGRLFESINHLITLHQSKSFWYILKSIVSCTLYWEQRKLISCLSLLKDGTHGTHKDYPSGPLLLSAKNIKNGRVNYDETDRRISYKDFEKIHSNFKLQVGDVLLTIVGSIGETALLQNTFGITFQRSVAFLRVTDNIIPEFLMSEINTSRFKNELENRKSTSAQPGIYLENLGEIPVFISKNSDEQLKIGSYFDSLNHLITLHQLEPFQLIFKAIAYRIIDYAKSKPLSSIK